MVAANEVELFFLKNYGPLFEIWLDGANGGDGWYGGACEKRTIDRRTYYDFERIHQTIHRLQPHAVIFSDAGPGCRWVGNEKGYANATNWSFLRINEVYPGYDRAEELQGGHADGKTKTDWLFTQTGMVKSFSAQTITTSNTHGTGCTLSAAITAYLARGLDLVCAVDKGKRYLSQAIKAGAEVTTGHGHGPLNHFFHPQKLIIQP